jgi:hypothetical protein
MVSSAASQPVIAAECGKVHWQKPRQATLNRKHYQGESGQLDETGTKCEAEEPSPVKSSPSLCRIICNPYWPYHRMQYQNIVFDENRNQRPVTGKRVTQTDTRSMFARIIFFCRTEAKRG